MTHKYIMAVDQGTTGSTVLLVDVTDPQSPDVVSRHTVDFKQYYPQTGWVEHDLHEVWSSVVTAGKNVIDQIRAKRSTFDPKQIQCLGITNQRETLCLFERGTAQPLRKAIVWQCKRSTPITSRLKTEGLEPGVKQKTGLVLDPYFSASKLTWILENEPHLAAKVKNGEALAGTIDTFLIARLTAGQSFVTEASNASRTMLYNIKSGAWDADLLKMFAIPHADCLPEVLDSAGAFGVTKGLDFLPDGIPITGVLGDQQAALAGQACFEPGEAKCTYGTGAFLLTNLGAKFLLSDAGMLTTVAWKLKGKIHYAFEGSAFIAGAAVQFLRDQLQFVDHASDTQRLADGQVGAPEVYFVPALAGLGAPFWDPAAQGAFFGLTRGTTRGQLIRACLEGIAFQVADLTKAMANDRGSPLSVLRVDGGAAANDLLMQSQADFSQVTVDRPANLETTAFGAALFAGFGSGIYTDLEQMRHARKTDKLFQSSTAPNQRENVTQMLRGWERAVRAVQVFAGTL